MSNLHSPWLFRLMAMTALGGLVTGCECDDPVTAMVVITSPSDGDTINLGSDTNEALPGIQIEVLAEVIGVAAGDEVELRVDGTVAMTGRVEAAGDIGQVRFTDVTVDSGMRTLVAALPVGGVESEPVRITVDGSCAMISFVTPEPAMSGNVTLGPSDDTDGVACEDTFETTVIISTDAGEGAEARVFVNGTPRRTARVSGATARFEGVAFENRGETPNTLSVAVIREDGVECRQDFPTSILVDCEGVSCSITSPATASAFLNADDDVAPGEDGFQGQFGVTTDAEGAMQEIELVINGDESGALSELPEMVGMTGVATFGPVSLSEGVHRVQGICRDEAGNTTRSGVAEWTVDTIPCDIAISDPVADQLYVDPDDDLDLATPGIQTNVVGTSDGADCVGLRVRNCSSIDGATFGMSSADWTEQVTLSTTAMQSVCADVQDEAGNVARATVPVRVRTDAPQLQIVTPVTGTGFNVAGTMGRTADLQPSSVSCEAVFQVYCTDVGEDVTLIRTDTMMALTGGTASCVADASAPAPYAGVADFPSVSLPTIESLGALEVVAEQTADRLTGQSTSISLLSDCNAPSLSFRDPMCGAVLRPGTQDVSPGTPGFQYDIEVFNLNVPRPPVDLTLTNSAGSTVYTASSMSPATGPVTEFLAADFDSGGEITLRACATDLAGNTGCDVPTPCVVTVADLPTLSIDAPTTGATLDSSDDCDLATPGLQIQVTATTNAADGSPATIRIGSAPATSHMAFGGMVTACVDAPQGRSLPVQVTVTDAARGMATASVTVSIDSMPPPNAIDDFAPQLPAVDRRAGEVRFGWTAVEDAGGVLLDRYEARCSTSGPITSEAEWAAADVAPTMAVPASAGTMQTDVLDGFQLGVETWCVLRGFDVADTPTPLPSTPPPSVTLAPTERTVTGTSGELGTSVAAIGDVNGDSFDDFIVGTGLGGGAANVYFGSASGPSMSPNVTILGPSGATGGFGRVVAGLGDVSGDGRPDFAVSARAIGGLAGRVFVFFGRASTTPWPATIDLSAGACPADICLDSSEAPALFGWALRSAGDFDGDGIMDIAIGAWRAASDVGRVYVILGSSSWTPGTSFAVPGPGAPDGFTIEAPMTLRRFGVSLVSAGDLSGDGRSELVVGASGEAPSITGAVLRVDGRAYPGAAMGLQTIAPVDVTTLATGSAGTFGDGVTAIGDHDGDGFRDLAVYNSASSSGQVRVFLQSGGTYSAASSFTVSNDVTSAGNDLMGSTVGLGYHPFLGELGRIDGDTLSDLFIGAEERGTGVASGEIYYGTPGPTARTRTNADATFNPATAESTGRRVAAYIGDVNGDGLNDFALGDPRFGAGAGRVVVYY